MEQDLVGSMLLQVSFITQTNIEAAAMEWTRASSLGGGVGSKAVRRLSIPKPCTAPKQRPKWTWVEAVKTLFFRGHFIVLFKFSIGTLLISAAIAKRGNRGSGAKMALCQGTQTSISRELRLFFTYTSHNLHLKSHNLVTIRPPLAASDETTINYLKMSPKFRSKSATVGICSSFISV